MDTPIIKAGIAKITGRMTRPHETNKDSIFVNITVPHPISGEYVKYKVITDGYGKFSIDVVIETAIPLIGLYTGVKLEKSFLVKLTNLGVTSIDIAYNSNDDIKNISIMPAMNKNDMTRGFEVMSNMIEYRSGRTPEPLYNKSTDYFLNYAKTILSERLEILNNDTLIL